MGENMGEERKIVYWACDEPEILVHESQDRAIESFLDDWYPNDDWPATIEVNGYARMIPCDDGLDALENLIDVLDENYGNPDGDPPEMTGKMREAAQKFANAVISEYEPWACEVVKTVTVDVKKWVIEHRPDWINGIVREGT